MFLNKFRENWKPYWWLPYFIITATGLLFYFNSIFFQFSYLDDATLVSRNSYYLANEQNILAVFSKPVTPQDSYAKKEDLVYYRPLLMLSFILDAKIGKSGEPGFFHFMNIVYLILATILLYLFLLKLKCSKSASLFLALVFSIHPILVEAVAWIPGRNDLLLTVFVLACFIYFLKFMKEGFKKRHFLLHFLFLFAALLTKESAVVVPAVIFLYGIFVFKKNILFSKPSLYVFAGWLIPIVGWVYLKQQALTAHFKWKEIAISVAANYKVGLIYLSKLVFPFNFHTLEEVNSFSLFTYLISGFLFLFFVVYILIMKKKRGNMIWAASWILLFYLPVSFIRHYEVVSDSYYNIVLSHRGTLLLIGFLLLVKELDFVKNFKFNSFKYVVFGLIVFTSLIFSSYFFKNDFRNRITFWESAKAGAPSLVEPYAILGEAYMQAGDLAKAKENLIKGISSENKHYNYLFYNRLGFIAIDEGEPNKAEEYFKKIESYQSTPKELSLNYFGKGLVALGGQNQEEAKKYFEETVKINPDNLAAWKYLFQYKIIENPDKKEEYMNEYRKMVEENYKRGNIFLLKD